MSMKSFSSTILLVCLLGNIHISNTSEYCQYQKQNDPQIYSELCPNICCPNIQLRTENTTCCNSSTVYITTTSTFTIFGCNWWTIFLSVISILIAISILVHYTKRAHILKHFKNFNSIVDSSQVFTISKDDLKPNLNENPIISEENPPSYSRPASPPPPSYVSKNP